MGQRHSAYQVTGAEAFYLKLAKEGLEGNTAAARTTAEAIEEQRARGRVTSRVPPNIIVVPVSPGSVTKALEALRAAKKLDPFRPDTARMALEPWLVEAALTRLGERRFTLEEQRLIVKATRTPRKVKWPEWWSVRA